MANALNNQTREKAKEQMHRFRKISELFPIRRIGRICLLLVMGCAAATSADAVG